MDFHLDAYNRDSKDLWQNLNRGNVPLKSQDERRDEISRKRRKI